MCARVGVGVRVQVRMRVCVCVCVQVCMRVYAGRRAGAYVCVCVFVRMRAGCAGVYGGGCVSVCVYVCLCVWVGWKGLEHCAKYFNYTEIICGLPIRCVVHSNPSACQIYDNIKIFFHLLPFFVASQICSYISCNKYAKCSLFIFAIQSNPRTVIMSDNI